MRATRKPTLWERQAAFLSTFQTLRDGTTIPGGVQHPQIVAALIEASAALVVGADLDQFVAAVTQDDDTPDLLDTFGGTD